MSEFDVIRFHSRKSPRLQGYDYASRNYYFITICTHRKQCIFGKPGNLNASGKTAEQLFLDISSHFPGVQIDKHVVMPNHIHGIIVLSGDGISLSTVLGQYKAAVTRKLRHHHPGGKIWQASFHDHIIRNEKGYQQIWNYIDTNPAKWQTDCFYSPAVLLDESLSK